MYEDMYTELFTRGASDTKRTGHLHRSKRRKRELNKASQKITRIVETAVCCGVILLNGKNQGKITMAPNAQCTLRPKSSRDQPSCSVLIATGINSQYPGASMIKHRCPVRMG